MIYINLTIHLFEGGGGGGGWEYKKRLEIKSSRIKLLSNRMKALH